MSANEDELPVMSAKIAPGAFMTVDFRGRRDMDPEVCVRHGGHCWKRDGMVTAGSVPTYTEYCKHCPAYRKGRPQESIAWSEPMFPEAT